jgi:hypothetical protein
MYTMRKLSTFHHLHKNAFITNVTLRQRSTIAAVSPCPVLHNTQNETHIKVEKVEEKLLPYSLVPGPKPIPILGNTWRYVSRLHSYI